MALVSLSCSATGRAKRAWLSSGIGPAALGCKLRLQYGNPSARFPGVLTRTIEHHLQSLDVCSDFMQARLCRYAGLLARRRALLLGSHGGTRLIAGGLRSLHSDG